MGFLVYSVYRTRGRWNTAAGRDRSPQSNRSLMLWQVLYISLLCCVLAKLFC